MKGKTTAVVVLGDLAQSPRMIAHVRMLCAAGAAVRLVGYAGDAGLPDLPPGVEVHALGGAGTARWGHLPRFAYLPLAGVRAGLMAVRVRAVLRHVLRGADLALVQVPPAVPGLPLLLAEARRAGLPLVIDWHNLSWAMLALRLGPGHPLVGLLRRTEGTLGRRADGHLAVTPILAERLEALWGIAGATVLPDRPAEVRAPLAGAERAAAVEHIVASLGGDAAFRPHRVVVSPTSWSLDEDMDLALDAVGRRGSDAPPVLLIATGRGPRREAFLRRAEGMVGPAFQVLTGWLSEEDFRLCLRAADLGLSLHRSASAADFPMKVSDMVGAGLPVLALDYGPGLRDGLPPAPAASAFSDAAGLAALLAALDDDATLAAARVAAAGADGGWRETWAAAWGRQAAPLLNSLMHRQ